ncbi:MAG: retropepsin-like aspartic protease [Candidatus Bathyarchaeum tardum]|nr:MAG: retropepsin-like aspartic protease [Candidatus Bathyarchaeum tardum]
MSEIITGRCKGAFNCKYLAFTDPKLQRKFRLPLVHIRLKNGNMSIRTDALVDSGATATFIPVELAEVLDIDFPKETSEAVGAGGSFPTFNCIIDRIDILKGTRIFCYLKNFPVTIPTKEDMIPHTILGRDSVFWDNDITFRERKQRTVFRTPKKKSNNYKKLFLN